MICCWWSSRIYCRTRPVCSFCGPPSGPGRTRSTTPETGWTWCPRNTETTSGAATSDLRHRWRETGCPWCRSGARWCLWLLCGREGCRVSVECSSETNTMCGESVNEWMFNDTPARKPDRLLGVRQMVS